MATKTPFLLLLPPELLFEISDHLPADGILALKLAHSALNNALPPLPRLKNRIVNRCALFAMERLRASPTDGLTRCLLCKVLYPAAMFRSSSSPACVSAVAEEGDSQREVVVLPPQFCSWHIGRLTRTIRTGPGGKNGWTSRVAKVCMHNGCIDGWTECRCACDSCGHRLIRVYIRYLNNDSECKRFQFFRNIAAGASQDPGDGIKGRLHVREECCSRDATRESSTIELPVHYQNIDVVKPQDGIP